MCEFCTQHGEGKKWYLAMRNYSRELEAEAGRSEYREKFMACFEEEAAREVARLDAIRGIPLVFRFVRRMAMRQQRAEHWGQVVPIEDVEQIVDMQDSIVRLPCACRSLTRGREARYCFGIGIDWPRILGKYPDYSHSLEVLGKEEAKGLLRSFDQKGLVHSVWTFKTPYIGGICNCDQDCLAYRLQVKTGTLQLVFRAEYVGLVNWDLCTGCRRCLTLCQYGAIGYSNALERATIDPRRCYGCGVCRAVCARKAITLKPRCEFANLPW
ncbi:MAG TPA: 4Fe-4S binding protein [Planctomycetota bacterium]|nr:4Fe-4S binding protein [Planctomycetota bacterium]